MENLKLGELRRKRILELLKKTTKPMSGKTIGELTGVSRQVVVQDIALLRTEGHLIVATARGYLMNESTNATRLFKVVHTNEEIEDELTTIVDLGGQVLDVMINHRIYGKLSASLNIKNRRDVAMFLANLKAGKSSALLNVTSGYHFHHVSADNSEILDEIEGILKQKKYLVEFMPYEKYLIEE